MTTLVAGGAGFIGSHLVERVGGDVFDLRTGQDARNLDTVKQAVQGKDLVFHLANIPAHRLSVERPQEVMHNNYLSTLNFAEACRIHDAKMVFFSSFGVYGKQRLPFAEDSLLQPGTPYGVAKKASEELLAIYRTLYGLEVVIVRPSNVWGDRDYLHEPLQVLPLWIRQVKAGKEIVVYGDKTTRDFTHISDFLDGVVAASRQKAGIFNISSGKETLLLDIAHSLTDRVTVKPLPPAEVERWCGDTTRAREVLGWQAKRDFWEEFKKYAAKRLTA
ncbi:MAG: NAD-dependent epimerase/dehydratase family protein [Candidatus Aenigmarchaeota archaeon]|nr:NAD-dependent epimerase/dehydratase family protein [Candidatus Aenigmarchaeota archaeon]